MMSELPMHIGLGFLVEVVAFVAAAYVVVALRPRLPRQITDIVLGSVGCAIGAGALLFQRDVSLAGGVLAPLFAAALLVGHVRVWDVVGVTLPAWVNIPPLGRRPGRTLSTRSPVPGDRGTHAATEPHDAARAGHRFRPA